MAGKVYKDEFIELNRDKCQVVVSIFQIDLVSDLDYIERQQIQVTGDQEWLISQIDSTIKNRRLDRKIKTQDSETFDK